VARRRLCERPSVRQQRRHALLAAGRVVAVDEPAERIEAGVLGERHRHGEPARVGARAAADRAVGDAERRAVEYVQREAGGAPAWAASDRLAQERDIRVVAAKEAAVERLE
jgi:hypothetical protein